jgi:hypothetical protein
VRQKNGNTGFRCYPSIYHPSLSASEMNSPLPTVTVSPSTTRPASPTTRSPCRAERPCTNSYRDWHLLHRLPPSRRLPSWQSCHRPFLANSITLFQLNEKRTTQMNIHSKQLKQIPKTSITFAFAFDFPMSFFEHQRPQYATRSPIRTM